MKYAVLGLMAAACLSGHAWADDGPPAVPPGADAGPPAAPDGGEPAPAVVTEPPAPAPAPAPPAPAPAPTPAATPAPAPEPIKEETVLELPDLQIHGFVSQGGYISTANNYLGHSKRGSVRFTEAGVNFSREVADRLRVGLQLFARDLAPSSTYAINLDWAFLDYRWKQWLGLRAGRVKMPFGLYNEYSDIDAARLPILLPQGVYPITSRDYLLAQTGFALYGSPLLGKAGALDYQAFFGSIFIPSEGNSAVRSIDTHYVAGGQLFWRTPLEGLRVGGTFLHTNLEETLQLDPVTVAALEAQGLVPANFNGLASLHLSNVNLWVTSLEYSLRRWLFSAEYSRWLIHASTNPPGLIPITDSDSERFYAMAAYHLTDDLSAGAYYSMHFAEVGDRSGKNAKEFSRSFLAYQGDLAATLRYDINEFWLVKLEGHLMTGAADLDTSLNPDPQQLKKNWGFFLFKTTLSF